MRAALAALAVLLLPPPGAANTVAERYVLSIAGIEIGEADLTIRHDGGAYDARLTGGFRFLLWSGEADVRSEGAAEGAALRPARFQSRFQSPSRIFETAITFDPAGTKGTWRAEPPFDDEADIERVPLRDADLPGAKDMISAFVIPAVSGEAACGQSLKVFSGVVRFDLDLRPTGRDGARVECKAEYRPLSGHRIYRDGPDRLRRDGVELSVFEMMPGVWAPHAVGLSTRFGTLSLTRVTE